MVLRAVVRRPVQRAADLHLLDFGNDALDVLVVDRLLHKDASGRDTVLSLVEEHAAHTLKERGKITLILLKASI